MQKLILAFLICGVVSGCAGFADAISKFDGIGVVEEEKSVVDGATIVRMSPAFLMGNTRVAATKLGAEWNSKEPDLVALIVSYASTTLMLNRPTFLNFTRLRISIDGVIEEYSFEGAGSQDASRTIYRKSLNAVMIPIATLQKMISAKDVHLQINAREANQEARFSVERGADGQSFAILHLREFFARVQAKRQKP
jgi:hypothetical protein